MQHRQDGEQERVGSHLGDAGTVGVVDGALERFGFLAGALLYLSLNFAR
jgi:hypothetical protein